MCSLSGRHFKSCIKRRKAYGWNDKVGLNVTYPPALGTFLTVSRNDYTTCQVRIPTLGGLLPLLTPKSSSQLYFPSSPCFGVGLIPKMQRNSINFISTINMSSVAHLQGHFVELQCVELCFERPPTTNSTGEHHLEPQSTCRVCISIS